MFVLFLFVIGIAFAAGGIRPIIERSRRRGIENQLPEFLRSDFPNVTEFFKQYYRSQEFQGGPTDLIENLDQYLK